MHNTLRVILVTLLSFGIYFVVSESYFKVVKRWLFEHLHQLGISHIITYAVVGIPIFLGTLFLHRNKNIFENLGLNRSIITAFLFAIICTLPMFLGYAYLSNFDADYSINTFLIAVVSAAFFEELYFRGFLFGQIYRYTHWGFIPSVIFGSVVFGLVHLYQATTLTELIGIFLVTFMGGILYAWVYVEWHYNLWVPIFLHLLMNLSWGLFSAGDNALGGMYSNAFRVATITLIIVLTLRYKRKKGEKANVNKDTIWMKKKDALTIGK